METISADGRNQADRWPIFETFDVPSGPGVRVDIFATRAIRPILDMTLCSPSPSLVPKRWQSDTARAALATRFRIEASTRNVPLLQAPLEDRPTSVQIKSIRLSRRCASLRCLRCSIALYVDNSQRPPGPKPSTGQHRPPLRLLIQTQPSPSFAEGATDIASDAPGGTVVPPVTVAGTVVSFNVVSGGNPCARPSPCW